MTGTLGINRAVAGSLALLGFYNGNGRVGAPKPAIESTLVEFGEQRGLAVAEAFVRLGDDGGYLILVRLAAGFQADGCIGAHPVIVNGILGFSVTGFPLATDVRVLGPRDPLPCHRSILAAIRVNLRCKNRVHIST